MIYPDPMNLPSVPFTERHHLPAKPGIYFALSKDKVVYIGQTVSFFARLKTHHRRPQFADIADLRIAWWMVDDVSQLRSTETALIEHFAPLLNRTHLPRKNGGPVLLSAKIDPTLSEVINTMAKPAGRTRSNMVEWLLRTHPQIMAIMGEPGT